MLLYIHKDLSLHYDQVIDNCARINSPQNAINKFSRMKIFDLFSQCVFFIKSFCKFCRCN